MGTFLLTLIAAGIGIGLKLQLTALDNLHGLRGSIAGTLGDVFDLFNDIVALKDLAEHDVPAIEPAATIKVFSTPSQTEQTKIMETYEVIAVVIKN
jgi:hypothetical protein